MTDKRRRVEEISKYLKENSRERRVRLISDHIEDENSRNMVCMSDLDNEGDPKSGLSLTPSVPEMISLRGFGVRSFSRSFRNLRVARL